MRHSRPLPSGEKRVLFLVLLHLLFLPWALGTMHAWSQATSLALAVAGFAVALFTPSSEKPETGNLKPETTGLSDDRNFRSQVSGLRFQSAWSRLRRFPPFWLGLALLLYIAIQALNPSWRYTTNGKFWWLMPVPNISWLPTSVDTPFARFNLWRQFIIYASAWLTLCTVWAGLTRRRSLAILFTTLAANALVLALVGFFFRLTQKTHDQLLWFERKTGAIPFASFIYKNHAGAYLALMAVICLVLGARHYERALKEHARSSPALLYVLGAIGLLFAVVFTYSRGATLLLSATLAGATLAFLAHRYFTRAESTTPLIVTATIGGMVGFVVVFALAQLDFRHSIGRIERLADAQQKDVSVNQRLDANNASLDMLAYIWPRGVGAGGFRYVYPQFLRRYPGAYRGGNLFWEHAHNDWLQIAIELGLVGVALIAAGGLWWLVQLGRSRIWRRLPALLLTLGLLQTLAHASFDFPFQNPAVLITWLGLSVVAIRYAERQPDSGGRTANDR